MATANEEHALGGEEDQMAASVRADIAQGRLEAALRTAEDAFRAYRVENNARGEAMAHLMLAEVRAGITDHDPDDTIEYAQAALKSLEALGEDSFQIDALKIIGEAQLRAGMAVDALESMRQCISMCSRRGSASQTASALCTFAKMNLEIGSFDEALRSAREATKLYGSEGDQAGEAQSHILASKGHSASQEYDDALQEAEAAIKCFVSVDDRLGEATATVALATAYLAQHEHIEALRAADRAATLFVAQGDRAKEVDALNIAIEARISLNESHNDVKGYSDVTVVMRSAERALRAARRERSKDRGCLATALYNYARILVRTQAVKGAWSAAKQAARQFRKVNNNLGRARAMILWSQADLLLGQPNEARANAQLAWTIFEKAGDDMGQTMAAQVCDDVDRYLGIPTQAELEAQRLREQEAQREYMLQMQQQMALGNGPINMAKSAPDTLPEHEAVVAAKEGPGAFKRDGSPLTVSAGMDPATVKGKIMEIALQIIGDSDDIEGDVPLMEAGLTSNTAVLLRDELGKDLPGIKLPPTLIFDYPSISAITDFVMERSG